MDLLAIFTDLLSISMDEEVDTYQNWLGALTASYKPNPDVRLKFTASAYQTFEDETYDISAQYWISQIESNPANSNLGQVIQALGVGSYLDHARNYFDGTVFDLEHRGTYEKNNSLMSWGIKYQHEIYQYRLMNGRCRIRRVIPCLTLKTQSVHKIRLMIHFCFTIPLKTKARKSQTGILHFFRTPGHLKMKRTI